MAFTLMISGAASAAPIPPDGSGTGQTAQGGNQTSQGGGQNGQQATGPAGPGSGAGNSGSASRLPSLSGTVSTSQSSQTSQNSAQTGSQGSSQAAVPQIKAEGAVLYDATRDQALYEKNADTRYYPASITKIMTALLVLEHCNLNDTVTFSQTAVTNLESGAVTLGVQAGDQFTVEQCLYGLLLKSANEIANGLAEHVSGSISGFADLMNQKAASLGCTNTHFVNPNGLNDSNHYTTARDMALIADAAFSNPTLCKIASTVNYDFPATASVPSVRKLTMGHKMVNPANSEYYSGIVGGKTGYTSLAGNTLVTCAERNGTRLVAGRRTMQTPEPCWTTASHWFSPADLDREQAAPAAVREASRDREAALHPPIPTGWRIPGDGVLSRPTAPTLPTNAWRLTGRSTALSRIPIS